MRLYEISPPTPWRAGWAGNDANRVDLFFDCADCGAQSPPIAGMIGSEPNFAGVGLLGSIEKGDLRPAMFCTLCFEKRRHKEAP